MSALLTSLSLSVIFGSFFIKKSQQLFRSKARPFTPDNHKSKDDMPTMGGVFITGIVTITLLLWCNLCNPLVWISLVCLLLFAGLGAWDDWNKIKYNKGISSRKKFFLQIFFGLIVISAWIYFVNPSYNLVVPFFKDFHPNISYFFIAWALFIIVGVSNAVNLTDGLDGLAIGALISNFGVFTLISYLAGHIKIADYLCIPFAGTAEMAVIGSVLIGASLGFLWFNSYPAQIFMGDVGSLSLGALLGFMALACKQEILLALAGGLFVIETLSVIVQIVSFKLFKKRFFKMAPIHHHFELLGWPESKITIRFCIISFILSLLALMTLKIR